MCYDIKANLESQLSRARRKGDLDAIREIEEKLIPLTDLPLFHASGFQHPKLLIYTESSSPMPTVANWGLVPHWVKDKKQQRSLWNSTLNARGETLFDKPSFRDSASNKRCIIYVDGFFEHHHFGGNTYPFYIHHKEQDPLALAGLWGEWVDTETGEILTSFTIVTTKANRLMTKIHNNPKLKEARMPVILSKEQEDKWLENKVGNENFNLVSELTKQQPHEELSSYTVHRLRGNEYLGNRAETVERIDYQELKW